MKEISLDLSGMMSIFRLRLKAKKVFFNEIEKIGMTAIARKMTKILVGCLSISIFIVEGN